MVEILKNLVLMFILVKARLFCLRHLSLDRLAIITVLGDVSNLNRIAVYKNSFSHLGLICSN